MKMVAPVIQSFRVPLLQFLQCSASRTASKLLAECWCPQVLYSKWTPDRQIGRSMEVYMYTFTWGNWCEQKGNTEVGRGRSCLFERKMEKRRKLRLEAEDQPVSSDGEGSRHGLSLKETEQIITIMVSLTSKEIPNISLGWVLQFYTVMTRSRSPHKTN